MSSLHSRRGAIEMSMGTIVTIVLLVTVLILGLVFIRTIFSGAQENIKGIDQAIKNEINKLFSEDNSRKVVVYPSSRKISISKGDTTGAGFGFSIRNIETTPSTFSYTVTVNDPEIRTKCNLNAQEAQAWIVAGGSGSIEIPAGDVMADPEYVRFIIPSGAPPCLVRFGVNVKKDAQAYSPTINVDVQVLSA